MSVFYVLHIRDRVLNNCIEAIRFLANPSEKHAAHLTVRGPYKKRIAVTSFNHRIAGETVTIDRVGNFFDHGQKTVYFSCSSPRLEDVWMKRDYPFNPHITLYDSSSEEFAKLLYSIVSKYSYRLPFRVDELEPLESVRGQRSFLLDLAFDGDLVSSVAQVQVNREMIPTLSDNERLAIIDRLCSHLSGLSMESSLDNSPAMSNQA